MVEETAHNGAPAETKLCNNGSFKPLKNSRLWSIYPRFQQQAAEGGWKKLPGMRSQPPLTCGSEISQAQDGIFRFNGP